MGATGEDLRVVAEDFRLGAAQVREHGSALRRQHLVWWSGAAAEEYSRRVRERAADLDARAGALERAAAAFELSAEALDRAEARTGVWWMPPT